MTFPDSSRGIEKFIRADLAALGGYTPHKLPETLGGVVAGRDIIKLDANENPYGCSPKVQEALAEYSRWHIYPDAGQTRLRRQLQEYTGVDADRIVAANGSGELLDYILCLFVGPGDEVMNCVPTFDLYRFRTLVNGGKLVNIPRNERDFSVNIKAVKDAITPKTKIIILANPNNPTGNLTPQEDIMQLADTGVPVLVDEAYVEFSRETIVPLVSRYNNLMVLRTFSKWPGLAGLRIGYGIFPLEVASYLMKIKLPYNVGLAAMVAVEATFEDMDYLRNGIEAIIRERDRLFDKLESLKWIKPFPSQANFIYCSVLKGNARELYQKLQDRGLLLRYFDQPLVQNGFRISAGKPEQTDVLIETLQELGEEANG